MVLEFWRRAGILAGLCSVAIGLIPAIGWAAGGIVTSSTETRSFVVEGTTASSLVRFMNGHAISGDHGAAYATIHPDYQLSLSTQQRGKVCVPTRVGVNVDFELTLPVAESPGGMRGRTRSAWNGFLSFARAHEAHHKASYLGCAAAFVAAAKRQSASQCFGLESNIRQMLWQMKRACEIKQVPFDRSQSQILPRLSLFAMARQGR